MAIYTTVPNDLREFLTRLPGLGVPSNKPIDVQWLAQVGFSGANHRSILNVLAGIDALDNEGRTTEVWQAFRSEDRKAVAAAVRDAYADLFSTFPDAHEKDDEALANFFRGSTNFSANTLSKLVRTFRVLTEFGDFESQARPPAPPADKEPGREKPAGGEEKAGGDEGEGRRQAGVQLNVNIQLHIPATAEPKVYDQLFAAMRKNLIDLIDNDTD